MRRICSDQSRSNYCIQLIAATVAMKEHHHSHRLSSMKLNSKELSSLFCKVIACVWKS